MTRRSPPVRGKYRPRAADKEPLTPALPKPGRAVHVCARALIGCGMDEAGALQLIEDLAGRLMQTFGDNDRGMQWAFQVQANARTRRARHGAGIGGSDGAARARR